MKIPQIPDEKIVESLELSLKRDYTIIKKKLHEIRGYVQLRSILEEKFGFEGAERVENYLASRVPIMYLNYLDNIASIFKHKDIGESQRALEFASRIEQAKSVDEVITLLKLFEREVLGIIYPLRMPILDLLSLPLRILFGEGHSLPAPTRLLGLRTKEVISTQIPDSFVGIDLVDIRPRGRVISGPMLQPESAPVNVEINYFSPKGVCALVIWVLWITQGCLVIRQWIPIFYGPWSVRGAMRLRFRLEPNENVGAFRIHPIGVNLTSSRVKRIVVPFRG